MVEIFFLLNRQLLEAVKASKLTPFLDTANNYDVIGIDEGQFVSKFCFSH